MVEAPKHPYAQALVAAVPVPGVKRKRQGAAGRAAVGRESAAGLPVPSALSERRCRFAAEIPACREGGRPPRLVPFVRRKIAAEDSTFKG
jgi:ABC-type dipeptide/oligopeptide/nickel transport system ATPase component